MIISESSVGDCVAAAVDACIAAPQMNLVITTTLNAPFQDDFIRTYRRDADDWQAETRPSNLNFNHGEYISRHGDALTFIESELGRKVTSNRACVSLIGAGEIMRSGDGALPSLMIIQAGFQSSSQETLYLSAYFRALEVQQFLPINFAELALLAERLSSRFPTIAVAQLTIFAFRAHANPGFGTHKLARLDQATLGEIEAAVRAGITTDDWRDIIDWLVGKRQRESIVNISGMATLATALAGFPVGSVPALPGLARAERALASVKGVVSALAQLETARRNGTHGSTLESLQTMVEAQLDQAVEDLRT